MKSEKKNEKTADLRGKGGEEREVRGLEEDEEGGDETPPSVAGINRDWQSHQPAMPAVDAMNLLFQPRAIQNSARGRGLSNTPVVPNVCC